MGRALWSPQHVYQLRDGSSLSVLLGQVRFYVRRTPATSATPAYVGGPLPRITSDARIRTARNSINTLKNKNAVMSHTRNQANLEVPTVTPRNGHTASLSRGRGA